MVVDERGFGFDVVAVFIKASAGVAKVVVGNLLIRSVLLFFRGGGRGGGRGGDNGRGRGIDGGGCGGGGCGLLVASCCSGGRGS